MIYPVVIESLLSLVRQLYLVEIVKRPLPEAVHSVENEGPQWSRETTDFCS